MDKTPEEGRAGTRRRSGRSRERRQTPRERHRRSANFTHFRELREEQERIHISYTSLSGILTATGIASPKTRRSAAEVFSARDWRGGQPRRAAQTRRRV